MSRLRSSFNRPRAFSICLLASGLVFTGCAASRPPPEVPVAVTIPPPSTPGAGSGKLTMGELDQLTYAFADRYFMTLGSAVDNLKRDNPDAGQRRAAHRIKVNGVLAMNDIASSQDPYSQVLNLLVAVTLQSRVWIDEGQADHVFGERAPVLTQAFIEIRRDAWNLAERVMTQDQMERLEILINTWRRQHPGQDQVAFVKFDEFASSKASNLAKELRTGGGLLAPLDDAAQELKEYRRLAERAFWYTKRAPSIAGLQAEAATNEIMASPEISQLFADIGRVTTTAERLEHRVGEVMTAITEHGPAMAASAKDLTGSVVDILRESRLTIAQAESGLKTMHTVLGPMLVPKPDNGPPGRPFDIREYVDALHATRDVLREANQLAGQSSTASELVARHMGEVAAFTDSRVDRIFIMIWITLGVVLAGILLVIAAIRRTPRSKP